jgi:three-Cys-motif partner protein
VVALRGYDELAPPPEDGRLVRLDHEYGRDKVWLWHRIANATSTAMRTKRTLPWRVCVDMHAACGVNRVEETGKLRWGTALLSLQVTHPFDMYVYCEQDARAAEALAARIEDPHLFGYEVLRIDLGSESLGADIAAIKGATPTVKIVVVTGDSNEAAPHIRHLLPAWPGHRYVLTLIDPPGANFRWSALDMLTARESMDVMFLFPEDMDIERNAPQEVQTPLGASRFDHYFPGTDWRGVFLARCGGNVGFALREHYKAEMQRFLGYKHFGRDFRVRNAAGGPIYTLCFASRRAFGAELWNRVNRDDPNNQILLPFDW